MAPQSPKVESYIVKNIVNSSLRPTFSKSLLLTLLPLLAMRPMVVTPIILIFSLRLYLDQLPTSTLSGIQTINKKHLWLTHLLFRPAKELSQSRNLAAFWLSVEEIPSGMSLITILEERRFSILLLRYSHGRNLIKRQFSLFTVALENYTNFQSLHLARQK